jgi:multidrug efflux pump subunit AcrB
VKSTLPPLCIAFAIACVWIVRLALRRRLSAAVMALLMLVLGVLSFAMINVDIFPAINLPVVILIYNYPGLALSTWSAGSS